MSDTIARERATFPNDVARDRRVGRRRERPVRDSSAGGGKSREVPSGGETLPEYMPDPLEISRRDYLVARNISADFAAKLLARIPGAVLVPWDVPAGSVVFPRCPQRGFARRLQVTCKRGHPLADAYVTRSGGRVCRLCAKIRRRKSA